MNNFDFNPELDLMFERVVELSPEQMYKAWTTPELLMKWFCPKPWSVSACKMDLVPGGIFTTTMRSPEGEAFPNTGCFVELVENKKLVWTDSLTEGFRPSLKSFMTAIITFEKHPQGTSYRAIIKHKNVEDRNTHEAMGFKDGWGIATDQLVSLMK